MLIIDQTGRKVEIKEFPKRIVSLVPSQTELLHHLGLENEVVVITKFCIHPDHWFRNKVRVGGTKQLHLEKIKTLEPDLILANKEENLRTDIEELEKDFPVWVSDVNTFENAMSMISSIGQILNKKAEAAQLIKEVNEKFLPPTKESIPIKACYLIWRKPYMTVGGDTFISNMMQYAGFRNVYAKKSRYPEVTLSELNEMNFDVLMLSSEPFPFNHKHMEEIREVVPSKHIILVDGEMFSWYGSRMLLSAVYFEQLKQQVLSLKHAPGN